MRGNGCVNLTVVIISQCIHTLNHHIVHLKKKNHCKNYKYTKQTNTKKVKEAVYTLASIKVFPHIQFCVQALLSAYSNILSNI